MSSAKHFAKKVHVCFMPVLFFETAPAVSDL